MMTTAHRLNALDAIRGFAAMYVVVYHMTLMPSPNLVVPEWAKVFVLNGGTGVTLFFVISGFTMCLTLLGKQDEPYSTLRFYIRRWFRIAPLFYFWLIAAWIRDYYTFDVAHPARDVFINMTFLYQFLPGYQEGYVWASWTLGVEIAFYAIFPFLIARVQTLAQATGFFLLSVLIANVFGAGLQFLGLPPDAVATYVKNSVIRFVPSFAAGMLVYFVFQQTQTLQKRSDLPSWGFALLCASVVGYWAMLSGRLSQVFDGLQWQSILFAGMTLGIILSPMTALVNRVTEFIGRISYSLYLNHPTIIFFSVPIYRKIYDMPYSPTVKFGLCFTYTTTALILASTFTYILIERPGMKVGSWLSQRLYRREKPAPKLVPTEYSQAA